MKKNLSLIALLLAVLMIAMCCVACGDDKKSDSSSSSSDSGTNPLNLLDPTASGDQDATTAQDTPAQSSLEGTYEGTGTASDWTLTINSDDYGVISMYGVDAMQCVFYTDDGTVKMTYDTQTHTGTYTFDGTTLAITADGETVSFTKGGSGTVSPVDDIDYGDDDDDDDAFADVDDDDVDSAAGMTVNDLLNTTQGKQLVETAVSAIESSSQGLATAKCYGEGQCFVVDCTLTSSYDSSVLAQMKPLLQEALNTSDMVSTVEGQFVSALKQVGITNATVKIRYLSKEGDVLAERTYS